MTRIAAAGLPPLAVAKAKRLIRRHCAERLDRHKAPTRIKQVDSIAASARFKKRRRGIS